MKQQGKCCLTRDAGYMLPISNFQDDKNFDSLQSGEGFERQIGVLQCVC